MLTVASERRSRPFLCYPSEQDFVLKQKEFKRIKRVLRSKF